MRASFSVLAVASLTGGSVAAQQPDTYTATRPTAIRSAPAARANESGTTGQLGRGASVQVLAREGDWVRVRLEGWVREADLIVADNSLRSYSAADIRSSPDSARGKLVRWNVEIVALQTADALRSGMATGEPYLLALSPEPERSLVYLAVPSALLMSARGLPPLARVIVTARVRNGRSQPAGVPILDILTLTRR